MELDTILRSFLDTNGKIMAIPAKRKMKKYMLMFFASKLESGRVYSEKEINDLINTNSTFNDPATVRRELYDARFVGRDKAGTTYYLEKEQPTPADLGLV